MPLSTNASNDEKGFSMVLRDIEHLYLLLKQANISTDGTIASNSVGEGGGQTNNSQNGDNLGNAEGEVASGIQGPRGAAGAAGPQGPTGAAGADGADGADGTIPLGPGGETMSIQTITACVDGVETTMYVYGYVVP